MIARDASVTALKGIGPKSAEELRSLGILTVENLLRFYPSGYDRPEAVTPIAETPHDVPAAVKAVLADAPSNRGFGRQTVTSFRISDGSAAISAVFFHMPYLKNSLHKGDERVFRGMISENRFGLRMEHPKMFRPEEYDALFGKILPVYPTMGVLSQKKMRAAVAQAIAECEPSEEMLPPSLAGIAGLTEQEALARIHFPKNEEDLLSSRKRLVFEEFLVFLLRIRMMKAAGKNENPCPMPQTALAERFRSSLPFTLTGAQQKAWEQIRADIAGDGRMSRLIQGDVGSGKTVLAVLALLAAVENGWQGALMAPTEVLARQHFDKITRLFAAAGIPVRTVLLTGSVKESAKRVIRQELSDGRADIAIGTHALIQEGVSFKKLGLVVTDEQHRFGVRQRETLGKKGAGTHMLVMSATPIPRTLAVILYGDLDISAVNELPAGRLPIKNAVITPRARGSAYRLILNELAAGHQAYIICPLVEESEAIDSENVTDYAERLRAAMPEGIRIAVLHGRMTNTEKNAVMQKFQNGEIQILVSTTVIEVGVDVPNATVMMVENAERFGLAQLHQLRGRVGRGEAQSYSVFVNSSGKQGKNERLEVLNKTNDGFEIAEADLRLRGPGDLFGIRQSGEMHFALGDIYGDHELLLEASQAATELLKEDPALQWEEHKKLKEQVIKLLGNAEAL